MNFYNSSKLLKRIMNRTGFSQREIASLLGVSEVYVSRIVNAEKGFPPARVTALKKYAEFEEFRTAAILDFSYQWKEQVLNGLTRKQRASIPSKHEKSKVKTKGRALRKASAHQS